MKPWMIVLLVAVGAMGIYLYLNSAGKADALASSIAGKNADAAAGGIGAGLMAGAGAGLVP